jgi:phenylacetyl-CoA:acceptor oxidoreductase subunit 1
MVRWGMVIDLKRCAGCMTCVAACKLANYVPPNIYLNKVFDYEDGEYPNVTRNFLPVQCMHCEEPPCKSVCPTGATYKRDDGIVIVDESKCIGCRYCMMACPYGARSFYAKETYYFDGAKMIYEEYGYRRLDKGTVMKCHFCFERIDEGIKRGLRPGIDEEATPICVISCIGKARYFGDLDDPDSEVTQLIRRRKAFRLHPELGTGPSIYYLPP